MRWNAAKSSITNTRSERRELVGRQHGASIVEFVVVLPALLILGLGSIQSALFHQAKTTVTYATFEAARTGATTHALKAAMLDQFGLRLAPVFGGDGSGSDAMAAIAKGKTEARNAAITRIDIINPTQEAFQDFGVLNAETGRTEIPNSHLKHRNANDIRTNSGVNIQDANLLKIKTTYGYHLKVPLINSIVTAALKKIDKMQRSMTRTEFRSAQSPQYGCTARRGKMATWPPMALYPVVESCRMAKQLTLLR